MDISILDKIRETEEEGNKKIEKMKSDCLKKIEEAREKEKEIIEKAMKDSRAEIEKRIASGERQGEVEAERVRGEIAESIKELGKKVKPSVGEAVDYVLKRI